jgi:hypothetical protein
MPTITGYPNTTRWCGLGIGADVTPSIFLPVSKLSPKPNVSKYQPKERRGKLNQSYAEFKQYITNTVDLTLDGRCGAGLEHLLYAALGAKTSTVQGATAAYKHVITEAQTRPVLTLYDGFDASDLAATPMKYTDAILNSLSLAAKSGGELQVSASFNTTPVSLNATAPTKTWPAATTPLLFNDMDFQMANAGSAVVVDPNTTDFSCDIKTTVTEKQIGNKSIFPGVRAPTGYTVSGKGSRIFDNKSMLQEWLGSLTATAMQDTFIWKNAQVDFTGPLIASTYNQKLSLFFPYLVLSEVDLTDDDIVEYSYTWETIENGSTPGVNDMLMKAEVTSALTAIA